ncbi:MAG TPA: GatB/YqeY domain-containing protein, partial [Candidatus Goldiibacteriota bacterium]|nr:GatB/YqeY domain-containing protein [Candidatus Goldiibacteriota bacterium]
MSILEKVNEDLKASMKARDEIRTNTLRRIKTAVMNAEIKKGSALTPEEVVEAVFSMTKAQADSIESFKKGGREDLAKKEEQELAILKAYLPEQLSDAELERIIKEAMAETGAVT